MSYNRKRDDEDDGSEYDPKSSHFCRACVDISHFKLKSGKVARADCPPDKNELGRSTWTLLHSMAAYYPDSPTEQQKSGMYAFLKQFAEFYPCHHCSKDLKTNMVKIPPKLDSRMDLSGWLCVQHNQVNAKLHKPFFDCSKVEERWRKGWSDGSCDVE
ncbi:hypothetical protein Ciccas_005655 [Cichlidogyrus casuarinus]|uniref:Sulfhydryl oxidase n=1 Tax=Cichlidogyrus casuarinus TaxID=1844966 RepID=A0ABD2Q820_9PLAT